MQARFLSAPLLIALIAIALGSVIDAVVKGMAPQAGLLHLLAWRFLFGAILAVIVFRQMKRPVPTAEAVRFHTARGLIQLASAFLFFYALMHLRLAEATTVGFTAALMVPFVARLILGEPISPVTFLATLIGFAGATLAVSGQPEAAAQGQRLLGLIACFSAAFLYALVLVMLRMRAVREDAVTIAMFTNIVPALALLPISIVLPLLSTAGLAPAFWTNPDWSDLPLFLFLGLMGYSVWFLMTLAYARAPAQRLAPLEYTALIWSAILGAAIFAEQPSWRLWAGALAIIASCLIVAFEDHFRTRRQAGLPASDIPE